MSPRISDFDANETLGCMDAQSHSFATPWTVAPLGFSVHGISQARILEWVAVSSSPTQGPNLRLLGLLHQQADCLSLGKPKH